MNTAESRIGFMQGRLTPLVNNKIQSFPWDHWREEFRLAHQQGFMLMEWTLDHERIQENPLMTSQGQEEIKVLCKQNNIEIPSLTGDFLMQKPFFKAKKLERDQLFSLFLKVVEACKVNGIGKMIFPLVDNGRLETQENHEVLLTYLNKARTVLENSRVEICFEIDLIPDDVCVFISKLSADLFSINYDIGNSAALGYDYQHELRVYGQRVSNVHVKDRALHGTTVPLGQGNADICGVIQFLEKSGYKGNYILQTARSHEGKHVELIAQYRDLLKGYLGK